jgi:peptidoglycan L-alanyl-D-glutamate endopeptidase CwlK
MASRKITDADPILQSAFKVALEAYAIKYPGDPQPFLTCSHRSEEEQLELYAQGRTKPGKIVTYLKKGSKHNSYPSKAIDIAFKDASGKLSWKIEYFKKFADLIKSFDRRVRWGGDWTRFTDAPHFEIE